MRQRYGAFPFRFALPTLQLLVCLTILWPIRGMLVFDVRSAIRSRHSSSDPQLKLEPEASPDAPQINIVVPPPGVDLPFPFWELRLRGPAMLNFPVTFVELPYILCCNQNMEWSPPGINFMTWRALTWPIVGLPFWWIAGRGLDALLAARRQVLFPSLTWAETAVAVLLGLMGLLLFIMPLTEWSTTAPLDRILFLGPGAIWASLGTLFVIARLFQWRIRRRLRAAAAV